MVYCCCTWKLLMSLKYTHYHANPPYIFLGGTSDSVSAVPFIWEGTADTWWYLHSSWSPDCFYWWEDRSHFSNIHVFENVLYGLLLKYGQFDEHTFTINAIPLIRSGGLSFFSFRFFFSPPHPSIYWCGRGQLCKPVMHGSRLQSEKTVASMCVYIW